MAKGDFVQVRVRGEETRIPVKASQNGRKIETEWSKDGNLQWFVAKEVTRGGTTVRKIQFPATEIVEIEIFQKEVE